jgi:enamine deaminase RidA (YjgF/YER057c/UK114 family)
LRSIRIKEKKMKKEIVLTPTLAKPYAPYAPGLKVTKAAGMIFISGVVPNDVNGEIVAKGDIAGQMRKIKENLKITLEAAGVTFNEVVKINTYVLGDYMKEYVTKGVDIEYLNSFPTPSVTLIGVASLANDGQLIESEVMAVAK